MGIGISIVVGTVGAILRYAVTGPANQNGFDVHTGGVILMIVGASDSCSRCCSGAASRRSVVATQSAARGDTPRTATSKAASSARPETTSPAEHSGAIASGRARRRAQTPPGLGRLAAKADPTSGGRARSGAS